MDIREFSNKLAEATKNMSPQERASLMKMFEAVSDAVSYTHLDVYKRQVVDYWTTREPVEFVTEVVVPIVREETRPLKASP